MWKCTPKWGTPRVRCGEPMSTARRTESTCSMRCSSCRTGTTRSRRRRLRATSPTIPTSGASKASTSTSTKSSTAGLESRRTLMSGTKYDRPTLPSASSMSPTAATSTPSSSAISSWAPSPGKYSQLNLSQNCPTRPKPKPSASKTNICCYQHSKKRSPK